MKKFFLYFFLLIAGWKTSTAQWVWAPLDSTTDYKTYFFTNSDCEFCPHYLSYFDFTHSKESVDGNGALYVDYQIDALDSWGGYVVAVHNTNLETEPLVHYDISNGKYLSFWMKVTGQAVKDRPGKVNFEFRLKEKMDNTTGEDRWLYEMDSFLDTAQNAWQQIIIPLEKEQFQTQSNDENGKWEPWNIYGFEIAAVYLLDSTYYGRDTVLAKGSFLIDKIQILGQQFEPLLTLDNQSDTTYNPIRKPAFWTVKNEFPIEIWPMYSVSPANENADYIEGTGSMKIDYHLIIDGDRSGWAIIEHVFDSTLYFGQNPGAVFNKLAFYLKTIEPSQNFYLKIGLGDEIDGKIEFWEAIPNVILDKKTGWQYAELPFDISEKQGRDLLPGDPGWALKEKANDGKLDLRRIKVIQLHFNLYRKNNYPPGGVEVAGYGTFLIDLMTGSGVHFPDYIPPELPNNVQGIATEAGKNFAIWEDVPGESGETYSVFYSEFPITSLNDPSVKVLATGIPEGTESVQHLFNYPIEKSVLKFWYAVLCSDKYGNTDSANFGVSPEFTQNTARLVPLVHTESRLGFIADGSLSEWSHLQPWELKPSLGTGTILSDLGTNGSDEDLSAKIWINFSNDSLYLALHVVDDLVVSDSTGATYDQDAVDFFFGAYEYNGADHTSFRRGEKPDYHIRFNSTRVLDGQTGTTIATQSPLVYKWKVVSDGYILEWKISWADLAALYPGDHIFSIDSHCSPGGCNVWPIPIDWVIYDADASGSRESGLRWSQNHLDNAWTDVSSWTYTFSYLPWSEGVEGTEMPNLLTLYPNYPNPFNPETTIRYNLPVSGLVSLSLYDVTGREIKKLVTGFQPAGEKSIPFNGSGYASGLYFLRLTQAGKSEIQKLVLLK